MFSSVNIISLTLSLTQSFAVQHVLVSSADRLSSAEKALWQLFQYRPNVMYFGFPSFLFLMHEEFKPV